MGWTRNINNGVLSVTAYQDLGGAVGSIIFGATQFIDTADLGRLVQTAMQWDGLGEANNPTQAGSFLNQPSPVIAHNQTSTSISVYNQMNYWYPVNGQVLSNDKLAYTIHLNHLGNPNIIRYVFDWYVGGPHHVGMLENLTTYLLPTFTTLKSFDPLAVKMTDINFATSPSPPFGWTNNGGKDAIIGMKPDKSRALGIYGLGDSTLNIYGAIYPNLTTKMDVACKVLNVVANQVISREVFVVVGTLGDVVGGLVDLRNSW